MTMLMRRRSRRSMAGEKTSGNDHVEKPSTTGRTVKFYRVQVPENIRPGEWFEANLGGEVVETQCPRGATPGSYLRLRVEHSLRSTETPSQVYEVVVPAGVVPGQVFAIRAHGMHVLVKCPENAGAGQRVQFHVPNNSNSACSYSADTKYGEDGWARTIRLSDNTFQWVRKDIKGATDTNARFDADKSAYVCKMQMDPSIQQAEITLVPADQAFSNSCITDSKGTLLVSSLEIANAQNRTYAEKVEWFRRKCKSLSIPWEHGHVELRVERSFLLDDSVDAVLALSPHDLRQAWRFKFIGEPGVDAGGLAREWFRLVTEEIFDLDRGLWLSSESNQTCLQINPAAKFIDPDYLKYYRFLGRIMGKALFDGQLVAGHMVQYLYKHILGWPIALKDIESIDRQYYNSLKEIQDLVKSDQDVSFMCLEFTTTQDNLGGKENIELIPGGNDIEVTNENFPEYLEACLKHRMLDQVKPQLHQLLLGFYEVVPEPLLTIFDFEELELLMCGLPEIDVADWRENTEYQGLCKDLGEETPVCEWFWEIVSEFDTEERARLLQFVTGTCGVPSRGFACLQGNDGDLRQFTLYGVLVEHCWYPRAHTCFNRLDLPMYSSKAELREKLMFSVTMSSTVGFDLE